MKKWIQLSVCILLCLMTISSCGDKDQNSNFDPNVPVEIESFYPDSGGIKTQVILKGVNFGTDTANIRVYFNEKRAAVIGSNGDKMYLLVPRLPGDTCVIKVKIGDQEIIAKQKFRYKKQYVVTTITGQPGTEKFAEGTLATATFGHVSYIAVDSDKNIFATQAGGGGHICALINEDDNLVRLMLTGSDNLNAPTIDQNGTVYIPEDAGDKFYELDPANLWVPRTRLILHPSLIQQSQGMVDFTLDWKHSFAFCKSDGYIYTRSYTGMLVKFDPVSRVGQLVLQNTLASTDSYLIFSPVNPDLLYIAYAARNCIYTYNIKTKEHKLFAGKLGTAGWKDGPVADALFNKPRQIALGGDGSLYIADTENHCIRQITPDGMVTTVVGTAGESGYVDGGPSIAQFNGPKGIAIDKDGALYIADTGNRCVRKLTIE